VEFPVSDYRKLFRRTNPFIRQALWPLRNVFARARRPIRVVAVSHDLQIGGSPLAQLELMLALKKSGVVVPIILSPYDGPLKQEYESAGICIQIIPGFDTSSDQGFRQSLQHLEATLINYDADIVYANTLVTFWAIKAAKQVGLPSIWNIREVDPPSAYFDCLPKGVRKNAYRCFRHAHRVIFVSDNGLRLSAGLQTRNNFALIYDALDVEKLNQMNLIDGRSAARTALGLADSELAIVAVGTIHEGKGQIDLIEAVTHMPEHLASTLRVYIVGDCGGPYAKQVRIAAEDLPPSLASRVQIVRADRRSHMFYSAADIAVCCSRSDTYPRVILEAMYFGLPIITTLTCGCELVRANENALQYQAGQPTVLASRLTRLLEDAALRRRLASASRRLFEGRPSFDGMVRQYGATFREASREFGSRQR
jgi:glycosyltransferase involved in cell wall biosynthesis